MSERIYWRRLNENARVEVVTPDATTQHLWERVHVLNDAELAAEKAKWQAKAWDVGYAARASEDRWGPGGSNPYRIKKGEQG